MLLANFNGKEHLRHRAVSLRQHGFLVVDGHVVILCFVQFLEVIMYFWQSAVTSSVKCCDIFSSFQRRRSSSTNLLTYMYSFPSAGDKVLLVFCVNNLFWSCIIFLNLRFSANRCRMQYVITAKSRWMFEIRFVYYASHVHHASVNTLKVSFVLSRATSYMWTSWPKTYPLGQIAHPLQA